MAHGESPVAIAWPSRGPRVVTNQTIGVHLLASLLRSERSTRTAAGFTAAIVDDNALVMPTVSGRQRALWQLHRLYGLDPQEPRFRALRALWTQEPDELPLLAGLSAFTFDGVFRASFGALAGLPPGTAMDPEPMMNTARDAYPGVYNDKALGKIARYTVAS